jgi:dienelactone hydrolase
MQAMDAQWTRKAMLNQPNKGADAMRGWRSWCLGCAALIAAVASVTGCSGGQAAALQVRLDAGPAVAPFVTPIHVTVSGLPPGGLVTVRAQTTDYKGRPWQSAAQFRASGTGRLSLATAVPVSGSYHTADAGGLLWSLRPAFTSNPDVQFADAPTGFTVTLQVLAGGRVQATSTLRRVDVAPTSTQTVVHDGFASTLFMPARPRPGAPAIVLIGGSNGGEPTTPARALAAAGYPTLALGYFQEPGLPQCLCDIPLEYFARALRWLRAQAVARGRPVILWGGSRGGEGALLIASYEPHLFDAVIASSPSAYSNVSYGPGSSPFVSGWTWNGKPLPIGTQIPVNRIRIPLLIGDGGQDAVWQSATSASLVMTELRAAHDAAPYTNLYYPKAGHAFLGWPPYFPTASFDAEDVMGGTPAANEQAMEHSWSQMIAFIDNPWRR